MSQIVDLGLRSSKYVGIAKEIFPRIVVILVSSAQSMESRP
jgi:hypothetical protein